MRTIYFTILPLALAATLVVQSGCARTPDAKQTTPQQLQSQTAPARLTYAALGEIVDPDSVFIETSHSSIRTLRVKAMAYTACSVGKKRSKRKARAARGAWGDTLTPGIKAVAVSPDLLQMGLDHGDVITIEGLPGKYKVLDVMHRRHNKSIDIYYGDDQCGAIQWGRRSLTISWKDD
ncbi:conserved hypothetical protein [Solidesulfovibrio fructosivorans JJ]]|uniref:3D domain protein n=1 Tax=Solidesulfovibrio fructosivorans JJ] TaxID=596151 RepID=E1JX32_SOLFR|nr:3D domain-containing protein [Solidesulfovibrio fructosivorans]EFL50997.1 conserved hypothetical protein [Solidesulfovibrio fructosivorans JJ]]